MPQVAEVLPGITIEEVFVEYDGPRLYSARSSTGQLYVVVSVDEDESSDTFLYLPVTDDRFKQIRSGGIELRQALLDPEVGVVFSVVRSYPSGDLVETLSVLTSTEIPGEWLPSVGASLDLATETAEAFSADALADRAARENRTLVAVEVEPPGSRRTEYPLARMAKLGSTMQEFVDALGQEIRGNPTARGAIAGDVLDAVQLSFSGVQAASFAMILAPEVRGTLFENDLLSSTLERLAKVVADSASGPGREQALGELHVRARNRFRDFLEALSDDETGAGLVIARPNRTASQSTISLSSVRETIRAINASNPDDKIVKLERAALIGANTRTGSFELFDLAAAKTYTGHMDPEAKEQTDGKAVGESEYYRAELRAHSETPLHGVADAQIRYRLISIVPIT